jgi:uncharacterized RDD family membrane protein YckC
MSDGSQPKGTQSQEPQSDESHLEKAIAEFLLAEDRRDPIDVACWLGRHGEVRDRLESFLENHRRTAELFSVSSSSRPHPPNHGLQDTMEFQSSSLVSRPAAGPQEEPVTSIGPYRFIRVLGSGGMGRVYEAVDDQGHRYAIKLIAGHMASTKDAVERFQQEGIIASTVNHPRCVFVHAADIADGKRFIAMELMPGSTLKDLIQAEGPLAVRDAIEKTIDIVDGLTAAHACKLIHRDVKPSNCYLDPEGRVKIGDFGLAKAMDADGGLTLTGNIVGTPLFASPEQLRGDPLDERTDVYSTCATLFYLLTGKAPFEHSNATTVIARVLSEDVVSLRAIRDDIPLELDRVIASGMSRNREQRPRTMQQLREQLAQFLPGHRRIAGLGLRFAAYGADVAVISIVMAITAGLRPGWFSDSTGMAPSIRMESHVLSCFLQFLYFLGCEHFFQSTLGKRCLGLNVRSIDPNKSLSFWQCTVRVMVWWLATGIMTDLLLHGMGRPLVTRFNDPLQWVGYGLGYLLLSAPLFWRSDQRMLHDLVSGTQVESVQASHRVAMRMTFPGDSTRPLEIPRSIGRFIVSGSVMQTPDCEWLAGIDPGLDRSVWIALRPMDSPECNDERRRMIRAPRLRWIGSGQLDHQRWDAFLGAESIPLKEVATIPGGMSWPLIRQALSELANEIELLESQRALFSSYLNLDAIRIRRDGSVIWMDEWSIEPTDARVATVEESIVFLNQVAKHLVSAHHSITPHVPHSLPHHGQRFLERLDGSKSPPFSSIHEVSKELRKSAERPSESTFRMRAIQMATLSALALAPLGAMFALLGAGHLLRLDRIEVELLRLYALRQIAQSETAEASFAAIGSQVSGNEGRKLEEIVDGSSDRLGEEIAAFEALQRAARARISDWDGTTLAAAEEVFIGPELLPLLHSKSNVHEGGEFVWELPSMLPTMVLPITSTTGIRWIPVSDAMRREFAKAGVIPTKKLALTLEKMQRSPGRLELGHPWRVWCLALTVWAALTVWGTLFRGGISRYVAGFVVVDQRSKPAGRIRILVRSALMWAPLGSLVASTILLEFYGLTSSWFSMVLQVGCVVILFVCMATGLLSSGRGPHDRIAGTRLAPH